MIKAALKPFSSLLYTLYKVAIMGPLSSLDINAILETTSVTRKHFIGTFPACITPKTAKKRYAFITNTDEHELPGTHWNAWFVDGPNISFFDSFGRSYDDETLPDHYRDIVNSFQQVDYCTNRIQGWKSVNCGLFCIHFIYIKCLGLDYNKFLNEYTTNFETNDLIVNEFIESIKMS